MGVITPTLEWEVATASMAIRETNWDLAVYKKITKTIAKMVLSKAARRWIRHRQHRGVMLYRQAARRLRGKGMQFRNREGFRNFDCTLFETRGRAGVSAMLRVKDEETKLLHCLRSIFEVFDEIVFVDNGSEDDSLGIAREFKKQCDNQDKMKIYSYPFRVARCGAENLETPEDSVHSLSYFYNWCLAQCSFRYVCKWDGDMVLRKEARGAFKELTRQIQNEEESWELPGQTVYRDPTGAYYFSKSEINREVMLFPYGFNTRFYKSDLYEVLRTAPGLPIKAFKDVVFYELKFADEDEFSHLSTTDFPTLRKKMERESLEMLRRGNVTGERFERLPPDFLRNEMNWHTLPNLP